MASTLSVACAIFAGCSSSSSSDDTAPAVDSGVDSTAVDATPDVKPDTSPIVDAAPEACPVDANLSTLPVPDASLGDGGATAAGCVACVKVACPNLLSTCQMTCGCVEAFVQFEACIGNGGQLITCAEPLITGDTGLTQNDVLCAADCLPECGQGALPGDGGTDGGDGATDDGGDGSADAAAE